MDEPGLDLDHLQTSAWRELRTELHQWDDLEEIEGYDCLTHYWCPDAVFEIY
ncbi:MAG: hypothetical protein ACI8UP_000575 [Porticoccaceae bacterium]|jgi:hypothetical protein